MFTHIRGKLILVTQVYVLTRHQTSSSARGKEEHSEPVVDLTSLARRRLPGARGWVGLTDFCRLTRLSRISCSTPSTSARPLELQRRHR